MKKLLVIFVLFITFFFCRPVPVHAFSFSGFFKSIFTRYFSPTYKINPDSNQDTSNYENNPVGIAKRVMPASADNDMKLLYITDVVRKYIAQSPLKNIPLAQCSGFSKPVTLYQFTAYIIRNYQTDLTKAEIETFLKTPDLAPPASAACLTQIWDNFYNTPQGSDLEKTESYQGNQIVREAIPEKLQSSPIVPGSSGKTTENDTKQNLDTLHGLMVPHQFSGQTVKERTKLFEGFLVPENQQK